MYQKPLKKVGLLKKNWLNFKLNHRKVQKSILLGTLKILVICTAEQEISAKSRRLLHNSGESAQLNRLKQGLRPGFPTCFSNTFPLNRQLRSRSRGVDWVASHYPLLLTYMFVRAVSVMSYLLLLVRLHDFRVVLM